MMLPAVPGMAYAYANWSRWCVSCPSPYCHNALTLPPFTQTFHCTGCGTVAEVVWPSFALEVERLLMMRPDPATRSWLPGEDLHDLLAENVAHGILDDAPAGKVLEIVGDRITHDALPGAASRLAVGSA